MKKINFIPAGDLRTASSRLRVYALSESLKKMGYDARINSNEFSEFLIIQKRITSGILEQVKKAKLAGSCVVYDVDDSGAALWYWVQPRLLFEILCLVDLITVDTPERAYWINRATPWLPCKVIPNPVDYGIRSPKPPLNQNGDALRICWFGNSSNFKAFIPQMRVLSKIINTKVIVCGASYADKIKFSSVTNIEFLDWELDGMDLLMRDSDLVCLSHLGHKEFIRKSNHKMITSISYGVPAIVSNTPEYARTANEIGASDSIFFNDRTLVECVETYRSKQKREKYLYKAQPVIWKKYAPQVCAQHFLDVIDEMKNTQQSAGLSLPFFQPLCYAMWRWHIEDYKAKSLKNLIFSKLKYSNDIK